MVHRLANYRNAPKIAMTLAIAVLAISISVMFGWMFGIQSLIKPLQTASPTQFTTALCIGLAAIPTVLRGRCKDAWRCLVPFGVIGLIAGTSLASHWFDGAAFINKIFWTTTQERGAIPGQMSVNTALLFMAVAAFGIVVRVSRPSAALSVLGQAAIVGLLGITISMMGLIFSNLPTPVQWSNSPTETGPITAFSVFLLFLIQLAESTDENGLPLRLLDIAEVVATAAIAGAMLFFGILTLAAPDSLNKTNYERMSRFLEHGATETISDFYSNKNMFGTAPHEGRGHDHDALRVCRSGRTSLVFAFELHPNEIHQVNCAYGMDRPSPGGSIYTYLDDWAENWTTINPTTTGSVFTYCIADTRCSVYVSTATSIHPSDGSVYVMTMNLGLVVMDYLTSQVIDPEKLETINLVPWIKSLPNGIPVNEALQSLDAYLWDAGLVPFDLRSERIKSATTLMSLILLGAILGVFILTQISQRTHTQFQEASRQLQIRQFYTRRFVYAAAHDLRAPLRGIEQLSAWARDDLENGEVESPNRYMALINSRIQHLSRLIEGILDLARLDNRENKTEQLPVNNAIEAAANLYRSPQIIIDTNYAVPQMVVQYEYDGLVRVLNNLLANAVSHHDQDQITIEVRASFRDDNLRIEVEDDGPGVPEGRHEMIFELFRTYSGNKEHTGVGMGLAMVRRYIEEWGGTIHVESPAKEGRGARFVILIPLDLVWKRGT